MKIKRNKKIFLLTGLIFILMFSSMTVFAKGEITSVSGADVDSIVSQMSWNEILIQGNDGAYYKGSATDFFSWLKDRHAGDSFTGPSENKNPTWGEVDSMFDSIDAKTFSASVLIAGKAVLATMRLTVVNILKVEQIEFEYVTRFFDVMKPIGFCICLIYFILAITDKNEKELLSPLAWVMTSMRLGVGIAFVAYSDILASYAYALTNAFINLFLGTNNLKISGIVWTENEAVSLAMNCDYDGVFASMFGFLGEGFNIVAGQIFTCIITVLLAASCYTRKLEIGIRSVFLPVGFADLCGRGVQGKGMNYFKKLLACALQAGGIVFLVSFSTVMNRPDGVAFSGFAIPIAVLGSITLAKKIAEEAFGS